MKKSLLILIISFCLVHQADAAHIKGGFFSYKYLGPGVNDPTANRYRITLTVYMLCEATPAQISNPINFSFFNGGSNQFIKDVEVSLTAEYFLGKASDEPCITGDQTGCYYKVVVYDLPEVELAALDEGYTVAYQRCCRIGGIMNVTNSGNVGNTFTIKIPGTGAPQNAYQNSSPQFQVNDTVVVCGGSYFQYSFLANDPDVGDSLSYSFCSAFTGGTVALPNPATAANPPYALVPYASPFSGSQPMGPGVTINPRTGLISGVAPAFPNTGEYVVCVCVNEFKNRVFIGQTRKELHVRVGDCVPIAVTLDPQYITCDGFSWTFLNGGDQSLINSYNWTFGDPASGANDSSALSSPTHLFTDTGAFTVTLIVNRGQLCSKTGTTIMKVYPGFFPGFTSAGICITNPVMFNDTTRTRYGLVDTWHWDFGDPTTGADVSDLQNPQWTYATSGPKTVQLIVTNSKGCVDTAENTINIIDKPPITLAFRDTLICINDAVQLQASGTGAFSWTPLVNIVNANSPTPTVSPPITTWYHVNLNDNGCINNDSVRVRVVNAVTLFARGDTTICLTDAVQLSAQTDGLTFQWTPAGTLNDPTVVNPIATPVDPITDYTIQAFIGSCSATDVVRVRTVPYPVANAGPPAMICYNTSTQLNGSHDGSSFTWTPTSYLSDPTILNPVATPPRTTSYILTVFDTKGCPKPGRDTIVVTVRPKVRAFAGRDTTVVIGQPLFFNATGGVTYLWSPATGLNDVNIHNPIGTYGTNIDSIRYKVIVADSMGCSDSAFVMVHVFKTNPYVFVPTAFTPNNDGRNDVLRPIAVGVQRINYFSVYNRWGELVFTTTVNGQGWDGKIKGTLQGTNTFVWMVSAVDYIGKPIFLKGTSTLIR